MINEAEAEMVRQIYRWCVEEQLSSYAIHRRLTAQGIPPRKSPRGRWAQSSVIEILRDSIYKGEAYYNRTQPGDLRRPYGVRGLKERRPGNGQGRTRRPQAEWIPVRVPANSVRLNFCMAVALSDTSGQYARSIPLPWPIH